MFKSALLVLLISFGLIFAGCSPITPSNNENQNTSDNTQVNNESSGSAGLMKFESDEELKNFLVNSMIDSNLMGSSYNSLSRASAMTLDAVAESVGVAVKADFSEDGGSSGAGATDYSQTNVQVEGVDEADIVKNDGKYIYTVSGNRIVIVDAYPADSADVVSEIEFDKQDTVSNIFVNGDKLIVFLNSYETELRVSDYDFVPYDRYVSKTHVMIYDINDRSNPEILKDFSVDGYYSDARMIGGYVYFISQESVWGFDDVVRPLIYDGNMKIASPEIYYFDVPYSSYNFHTISSIDLNNLDNVEAKTLMLGYSNELYVSENNIYITSNKYYERDTVAEFFEIISPLLDSKWQKKLDGLNDGAKIVEVLQEMYNSMNEKEVESLIEEIRDAQDEYWAKMAEQRDRTVIHKINIDEGKIEYDTKGEVPGSLLNQFSLDEFEGNLRVATTTSYWTRTDGRQQYNNVYVLNSDLEQIGEVEKIAPDERIYSTRFMGDKLYMVTFRQVDPLFVIDLSDAKNPKILGNLKIPGFSDYLQMFDENILIGIGKETYENEWGGTSTKGVKISMFDVSDFENPKEVESIVIGNAGSYSLVSEDHKALLLDREKGVMVVPLREVGDYGEDVQGYYRENVWNGVYVFGVSSDGFEEIGKISHDEGQSNYYYWSSPSQIKRSLYIDDVLYTISEQKILMNELVTVDEIGEVDLKYEEEKIDNYPYPYYVDDVIAVEPNGGIGDGAEPLIDVIAK